MKLRYFVIPLIIALTANSKSNSPVKIMGGESSGGGGGFYCPGTDTVEVLDLWEGRSPQVYNFKIPSSNENYKIQLGRALDNLIEMYPDIGISVRYQLEDIERIAKPIDPSITELPFPDDAKPKFVKPNCVVRGIMYFDGENKTLWYDPSLLSKLSQTDLAAIWLHEALYKYMRERVRETDSVAARRVVACSFSESGCREKLLTLNQILPLNVPVYKCENSNATYFYFIAPNSYNYSLVISRYTGYYSNVTLKYPVYFKESFHYFPTYPTGVVDISHQDYYWKFGAYPLKASTELQGFEKTKFNVEVSNVLYSKEGGIMPLTGWMTEGYRSEKTVCTKFSDAVDAKPPVETFPWPNPPASATGIVNY